MRSKAIVLDLDDTLLSTHYRQFACINDYLLYKGIPFILFEDYLSRRRLNNLSNTNLLKSLKIQLDWEKFTFYYMQNIESERYLDFDELIVDRELLAKALRKDITLILLSLRGNAANSMNQLKKLGLAEYFKHVYFEPHNDILNPKQGRLSQLNKTYDIIAFCGDSIFDYEAALNLNINFAQVRTSLYQLPDFERARHYDTVNQFLATDI
ncbi:MAG TPA: HAD hydrolase-like protein [Cyclobacteriaceae bacterium]|nr:HAD hydrolase-like protein [Cyclobacteriaceae bacterium]